MSEKYFQHIQSMFYGMIDALEYNQRRIIKNNEYRHMLSLTSWHKEFCTFNFRLNRHSGHTTCIKNALEKYNKHLKNRLNKNAIVITKNYSTNYNIFKDNAIPYDRFIKHETFLGLSSIIAIKYFFVDDASTYSSQQINEIYSVLSGFPNIKVIGLVG